MLNKPNDVEHLTLPQNSEIEFTIDLTKFELNECFSKKSTLFSDEHSILDLINQKLNIQYSLLNQRSYDLKFEKQKLSKKFKNSIFKMPLQCSFYLAMISNTKTLFFYTLMLVATNINVNYLNSEQHFFTIEILDRMKMNFLNGEKKWKLKVSLIQIGDY